MKLSEYLILSRNNVTNQRRPLDMRLRVGQLKKVRILVTKRPGKVMTFKLPGQRLVTSLEQLTQTSGSARVSPCD